MCPIAETSYILCVIRRLCRDTALERFCRPPDNTRPTSSHHPSRISSRNAGLSLSYHGTSITPSISSFSAVPNLSAASRLSATPASPATVNTTPQSLLCRRLFSPACATSFSTRFIFLSEIRTAFAVFSLSFSPPPPSLREYGGGEEIVCTCALEAPPGACTHRPLLLEVSGDNYHVDVQASGGVASETKI